MNNPSELWMRRDHKHDLAFRPLETALLGGKVDAIYTQSKVFQHLQEATGQIKMIEDLSRYPDWTIQVANTPAVITCTDVMADEHPELVIAYMKAMIKVGRWANENKHAAGAILNRQTFYLDAEDTYQGIKDVDMVPSLSAQNMQCVKIGKDFMVSHGYIKNDFDVDEWARPEFLEQAATEVLKEEWQRRSWSKLPRAAGSRSKARGSGSRAGRAQTTGARSQAQPSPPVRWTVHHDRQGGAMTKTAAEMVGQAMAQIENVSPEGRLRRDRRRHGASRSTSESPWSGSTTSRAPCRCRGACSSSRPIPRARATTPSSTRPAA